MTLVAAEQSFLGIALETTAGTPVAPTNFLRVAADSLRPTGQPNALMDESMQGSMVKTYDTIAGVNQTSVPFGGNVYADEIGWLLASILGDLTVTGAGDPYTTTFAAKNNGQPKSYTLTDYDGIGAVAYGGCMCSDLSFTYSQDGLLTYAATMAALNFAGASNPTEVPGTTKALPTWAASVLINSLSTFKVIDFSCDIKRTVSTEATLANSQFPTILFAGGDLDVTGTATLVMDTTAQGYGRGNYTHVPLSIDLISPASANRDVKLVMTDTVFTAVSEERSFGRYTTTAVTFQANANSTDAGASGGKSPIKATTKAANPSGTYA
jgi:hypothetical protein